jgi:purine-binding chemotaxis protein CheW
VRLQRLCGVADDPDVYPVAELSHDLEPVPEGSPGAVVIRFGGARYAVETTSVAEVIEVPVISRVPGCPGWLAGVGNWRGRVLPVIDPRVLLSSELIPWPSSARLLVLSVDGIEAGLIVEAVAGLLEASVTPPQPAPATASASAASLVLGVVADATGALTLLDPVAVLALRRELPNSALR